MTSASPRAGWLAGVLLAGSMLAVPAAAEDGFLDNVTFSADLSLEGRWFPEDAQHAGQRDHALSFALEPELYLETEEGYSFAFSPFFRYDRTDPRRTHADIREAYALFFGDIGPASEWELRIGVDKVFWGVAESRHLVDIINQTDLVEDPDQEDKLGQPMFHATVLTDYGTFEAFWLPFFRERTFPGRSGRLRTALQVDTEQARYESSADEWHQDVAARYSHSIDIVDFGVSAFVGTNREPALVLGVDAGGSPVLVPEYDQIQQVSVDAQVTTGAWLLKFEGYGRAGERNARGVEEPYAAIVAGFEYTFFDVLETGWDIGALAEILYDERGDAATNPTEHDIFIGTRFAANDAFDTDLLIGVIQDYRNGSRTFRVESSRRLDDNWSIEAEGSLFMNIDPADPLNDLRRDSFIELQLNYSY